MSDAIRQWVAGELGLESIWLNPNANRPDKPYASMQITSSQRVGQAYYSPILPDGDTTVRLDREVVVSISIYESTTNNNPRAAMERAEDLRDSLEKRSVLEGLINNGWAVRAIEMLDDVPELVDTKWEPRAVFDVRMGTTKEMIDNIGVIESIGLFGGFDGVGDETYTPLLLDVGDGYVLGVSDDGENVLLLQVNDSQDRSLSGYKYESELSTEVA